MKLFLSLLILCVLIGHIDSLNAVLKSWKTCPGKNYKTKLEVYNIKHLGNYVHKIDTNATIDTEIGPDTKYAATIYKNNRKLPLNFNGRDACKAFTTMFGDLANHVLDSLQPKVGKCPAKKGFYTLRGTTVDAKQINIPLPVKGDFKVKIVITDLPSNKEITCIELVAELQ